MKLEWYILKGFSVSDGLVVVGTVRRVFVILVWLSFSVNFLFSDDVMQFLSVGISMCRSDGSLFCFNDLMAFMYFSSVVSSFDNLMRCPRGLGTAFFLIVLSSLVSPGSGSLSVARRWKRVSLSSE